jgi:hypothetical protein
MAMAIGILASYPLHQTVMAVGSLAVAGPGSRK